MPLDGPTAEAICKIFTEVVVAPGADLAARAAFAKKKNLRLLLTGLMFAAAVIVGLSLWRHYQYSPWTRDGRIKADVIAIAPDVSGTVTELLVRENQRVKRGEVLLRIDAEVYPWLGAMRTTDPAGTSP